MRRPVSDGMYELGADEKVVQRILRHAKSHVTKDRYSKHLIRERYLNPILSTSADCGKLGA